MDKLRQVVKLEPDLVPDSIYDHNSGSVESQFDDHITSMDESQTIEQMKASIEYYIQGLELKSSWETEPTQVEAIRTATPILFIRRFMEMINVVENPKRKVCTTCETDILMMLNEFVISSFNVMGPGTFRLMIDQFIRALKFTSKSTKVTFKVVELVSKVTDLIFQYMSSMDAHDTNSFSISSAPPSLNSTSNLTRDQIGAKIAKCTDPVLRDFATRCYAFLLNVPELEADRTKGLIGLIEYIHPRIKDLNRTEQGHRLMQSFSKEFRRLIEEAYELCHIGHLEYGMLLDKIAWIDEVLSRPASPPANL